MIALLRNEMTRYRCRRTVVAMLALAALAALAVGILTAWETRPASTSELATARAQAELASGRNDLQQQLSRCLEDPSTYLSPGASTADCQESITEQVESFLPRGPLDLGGVLAGRGLALTVLVASLLMIAATSFIGGDLTHGSIRNQVLFAPSRTALWGAKALAVTVWSLLASAVILGGFWAGMWALAEGRGAAIAAGVGSDIAWHLVRAVVFAAAASLGAFALTTVLRSGVATLGILFAYSVGGELLLALLPVDRLARWTPGNNVFGWLESGYTFFDGRECPNGDCGLTEMSHAGAGAYLAVLLAVVLAAGIALFRRRDL